MSVHLPADPSNFRRPKQKTKPFTEKLVLVTSLCSAGALAFAIPNLLSGSPVLVGAKTALLTGAAFVVSYGVNKLAVERGAPLANNGYATAGIASVFSILAVGGALFCATYSGLVYSDVERLNLERYGRDFSAYVGSGASWSAAADTASSAVRTIGADLKDKAECELASSCISGRGNGGAGPVSRAAEAAAGKAQALTQTIEDSQARRTATLNTLGSLQSRFNDVLSSEELGVSERRKALQELARAIGGTVSELLQTIPLAELRGYAAELRNGITIPKRPEAQERLSAILAGHGTTLQQSLASVPVTTAPMPAFPAKTGVSDTFAYLGHFLPIAAITAVVEVTLPILIWFYAYTSLHWAISRIEPPLPAQENESDLRLRTLLPQADAFVPAIAGPQAGFGPAAERAAETTDRSSAKRSPGRPRKAATNGATITSIRKGAKA